MGQTGCRMDPANLSLDDLLEAALHEQLIGAYEHRPHGVRLRHHASLLDLSPEEAQRFLGALLRRHQKNDPAGHAT